MDMLGTHMNGKTPAEVDVIIARINADEEIMMMMMFVMTTMKMR